MHREAPSGVLRPDSPRWGAFVEELESLLSKHGCAGGTSKRWATAVMYRMGDIDVASTLAYFEDHGGYCDCEILLNVDPTFWERMDVSEDMDRTNAQ